MSALLGAVLAASLGVGLEVDVSAAYGVGSRPAFGGFAGLTASEPLWEAAGGTGSLDFGFLAGYQAEPYALQAAAVPEARVSGATHRFEGLFLVGHSARLLSSRRLLIAVHLFGGWAHVVLRGALSNDALGISRDYAADGGRLVTGLGLTVGFRVTESLSVNARLLAPFPYASAVISYLIPTLGISIRL